MLRPQSPCEGSEAGEKGIQMSFWRLYYHMVWATKNREALINDVAANEIRRSVQATSTDLGVIVHAMGIVPDHMHIAVSIPPRIAVSEFARKAKAGSSHLVNRSIQQPIGDWFLWQRRYGVLSFGERSLNDVIEYVNRQSEHHADDRLWPLFETTSIGLDD